MRSPVLSVALFGAFGAGLLVGRTGRVPAAPSATPSAAAAAAEPRVFELRTYTSPAGKLPDLQKRFREHTMEIFARHGMTNIGYWTPMDSARRDNTIVYLLAYPSRAARDTSWAAFGKDPEWRQVSAASEANGKIVEKVESVFLTPTDFSPMK